MTSKKRVRLDCEIVENDKVNIEWRVCKNGTCEQINRPKKNQKQQSECRRLYEAATALSDQSTKARPYDQIKPGNLFELHLIENVKNIKTYILEYHVNSRKNIKAPVIGGVILGTLGLGGIYYATRKKNRHRYYVCAIEHDPVLLPAYVENCPVCTRETPDKTTLHTSQEILKALHNFLSTLGPENLENFFLRLTPLQYDEYVKFNKDFTEKNIAEDLTEYQNLLKVFSPEFQNYRNQKERIVRNYRDHGVRKPFLKPSN